MCKRGKGQGRLVLCIMAAAVLFGSCSGPKEKVYKKSRVMMDTLVSISIVSGSEKHALKSIDAGFKVIERLDLLLNYFSEESEVSRINRNAGIVPVKVSPETLDVIDKAIRVSEKTDGAFDITIGPLISLWDFSNLPAVPPDDRLIKERLRLVNYRDIIVDRGESTVYLAKKGMSVDLGGIAKGYAADKVVEELKTLGINSGLVSVAGDIKAFGLKPDKTGWTIGIKNPRQKGADDEIMAVIKLMDEAVSTSGDYERYFMSGGRRYHHLIDPHTGYPSNGCRSVSVFAKDGVYTDAFSTGVFVLGVKKGMKLIEGSGLEAVIVDSEGSIHTTGGLKERVEFKRNI